MNLPYKKVHIEGKAVIVFILNAGSIGAVMGREFPGVGDVDISDGYLDSYAVTSGVRPVRAIYKHIYHSGWYGCRCWCRRPESWPKTACTPSRR